MIVTSIVMRETNTLTIGQTHIRRIQRQRDIDIYSDRQETGYYTHTITQGDIDIYSDRQETDYYTHTITQGDIDIYSDRQETGYYTHTITHIFLIIVCMEQLNW